MSLPRPIVAYQQQAPSHPDPFGPWCKLHHAFFTHLAEARLSGSAYKVVMQVLCTTLTFGQHRPAALSLEQFQQALHLGRKTVIAGVQQALAKGILYEERERQPGAHTPRRYGLVFYCALTARRPEQEQEPGPTTGAKSPPVGHLHLGTPVAAGAETEPELVRKSNQYQCEKHTRTGAKSAPVASHQSRQDTASSEVLDREEREDTTRIQATLAPHQDAAQESVTFLEEVSAALSPRASLPPPSIAPACHIATRQPLSLLNARSGQAMDAGVRDEQRASSETLATLRAEYTRRQEALCAWRPHGIAAIQAKIAERIEVLRLARRIEELEAALDAQPPHQRTEDIGAEGQHNEAGVNRTERLSSPELAASELLQVAPEQIAVWQEDVVAQRHAVMRVKTQYLAVTEELQQCRIGRGRWGDLIRQQRFLARELEEQEAVLTRYERFLALIAQGATKDEACAEVLAGQPQEGLAEDCAPAEAPHADGPEVQATAVSAEPAPRLERQKLRQALFTTLAGLFTTGDPRQIALERGRFNTAIKKLTTLDVQPKDVPVLQAVFQRLWPKATCTALGLANNLPILINKAQELGWI